MENDRFEQASSNPVSISKFEHFIENGFSKTDFSRTFQNKLFFKIRYLFQYLIFFEKNSDLNDWDTSEFHIKKRNLKNLIFFGGDVSSKIFQVNFGKWKNKTISRGYIFFEKRDRIWTQLASGMFLSIWGRKSFYAAKS